MEKKTKKAEEFCGVFEWPDDGQMIHKFPQTVACPDWETKDWRMGELFIKSDLQYTFEMDTARAANKGCKIKTPDGELIPIEEITVQRIEFKEFGKTKDTIAPLFAKTLLEGTEVFLIDAAYFEGIATYADGSEKPVCLVPFSEEVPWEALKKLDKILNSGLYQDAKLPDIVGVRPKNA